MLSDRLITVAIHTYERAHSLKAILEKEGIAVSLHNVNLTNPSMSAGIRVRIKECDLPQALRIIENIEILSPEILKRANADSPVSVLVPVDFSDNSLRAAIVAFRIASVLKSRIHLIHSYADPLFMANPVTQLSDALTYDEDSADVVGEVKLDNDLRRSANESMRKFEEKLRDKIKSGVIPGVQFTSEIVEGIPEEVINEYCENNQVALTVMGTHGADDHSRQIVGSVTAEVLDACKTITLTVPEKTRWASVGLPSSVILFTTYDQEDLLALDTLYRLFPESSLNVTLVSLPPNRLSRPSQQSQKNMLLYCRTNYPAFKFGSSPLSEANPIEDFDKIISNHPTDMIVVASRRKNIFSRLFNPSLAHRLLFHTDTPLLSIPVKG